jgi:hypothetical protein
MYTIIALAGDRYLVQPRYDWRANGEFTSEAKCTATGNRLTNNDPAKFYCAPK